MAKRKKISKKTIIISVLLLIAIIIATTMTVIFLKDRGKAEATDVDISGMQEQDRDNQGGAVIDSDRNDGTNPVTNSEGNEQNNEQNNQQTQGAGNEEGNVDDTDLTSQTGSRENAGTTTGTGTGTTTSRDNVNNIGTTTIQRVETEEVVVPERKISENHDLKWIPTALADVVMSARLNTNVADLTVTKEAVSESGNTLVSAGEKITYKISVTNNSDKDIENIDVTDIIPEHTIIDYDTKISNDGKVEENKVVWNVSVKSKETITLEFAVIVKKEVNALENVTIKNVAVANGEKSNEVKNSILETKKTSKVFRNGVEVKDTETEKAVAKKGDIIRYIISVKNKGEVEGTAKVIDDLPGNLELTKNNKYTKDQLKDGIDVTVPAGKTELVEIEVKVKEINGEIKNVATVGEEKPTDERDTINITGKKENITTNGFVKPGDELTYEITLTNSGNKAGKTTVTDIIDTTKVSLVSSGIKELQNGEKSTYIPTESKVVWENIEVIPGKTRVLTVTVKVLDAAIGTLVNGAKIDGETDIPETKNPIVTFNKTSVVTPDLGKDNNVAIVKEASKITYTINVNNTGNADAKNINVKDTVPANTTLDKESITEGGKEENGTITWAIDNIVANQGKKLSFTVTVGKQANGKILNTAYVNGTPTNEDEKQYYNPELTSGKTSKIYKDGKLVTEREYAKVGDEIEYTITVANSGKVPGTANVSDKVTQPGVSFINEENGVTVGSEKYSKSQLENGIKVEVPANGKIDVVFRVKVTKVDGKITNTAAIPETTPDKPTDERETVNITGEKNVDKQTVKEQEELTYKIKLHNSGSKDGTVIVKDSAPTGTKFVEGSVKIGEVAHPEITETKLANGISVPVKAGADETVSFKVTVKTIEGEAKTFTIKNTALLDEKPTNETVTEAEKVYVSIIVNKKWEDNEEQAKRRPDKIKFEVYAGTSKEAIRTHEMNIKDGEKTYTFENLPKYNMDGSKVEYTASEKEITVGDLKFYTSTSINTTDVNGNKIYEFTNKFTRPTDKKDVTIIKEWVDNNNSADKRPDEVTLQLNGDNKSEDVLLTVKDNADKTNGNKWSATIEKDVYDANGKEIQYTATEAKEPKFYNKTENGTLTVKNTFEAPTSEKTRITIKKVWDDNANKARKRPAEIKVTLKATNETSIANQEITLNGDMKAAEWTKEVEVQKYNSKADLVNYIITENGTGSKFYVEVEGVADLTVENKFEVPNEKKSVEVIKLWNDNKNVAGKRPDSVTLQVTGNGTTANVQLDATNAIRVENEWKDTIDLPKYDANGDEIQYTATEAKEPEFYHKTENGLTVTNKFEAPTSEKTKITIKKVWDDNENKARKRPTEIKVTLKATNETSIANQEITLNGDMKASEWTKEIEVQKYNSKADLVNYVITENGTGSKFYVEVEGVADLTVENKFEVPDEKTSIIVKKIWNDGNKQNRPNVSFEIKGSDLSTNKTTVELTSADANLQNGNIWEKEITTLKKYDANGNEITYTVDEINIPDGYVRTKNGNEITNSLPGIDVQKSVSKVNDIDMTGVNQITVKENDIIEYLITVKNTGTVTLTNVDVTDNLNIYLNKSNPETTHNVALDVTLLAGESKTYTVYYKVTKTDAMLGSQSLKNVATATGDYIDSNDNKHTVKDDDDAVVTIKDIPGIDIEKAQEIWRNNVKQPEGTKVEPGDKIKYVITVTNTGNTVLNNVVVTDSMTGKDGFVITEGNLNVGTLGIAPNNVSVIKAEYTVKETDMAETEKTIANEVTVTTSTPDTGDHDEVEVITKVWKAEFTINKSGKLEDGTNAQNKDVEYGDKITYTLSAENIGNTKGDKQLKDSDLATLVNAGKVSRPTIITVKDFNTDGTARQRTISYEEIVAGVTVHVPAGKTATVEFTVTVTAKPGEEISNAVVGKEDKPVINQTVKNINVKSNTGTIAGSNYVLVIDTSSSMGNKMSNGKTRLENAKTAINNLAEFLFAENPNTTSTISVVQFNTIRDLDENPERKTRIVDVNGKIVFGAKDYPTNTTQLVKNITAHSGTNIEAGLNLAGDLLYGTDGIHANNLTKNNKDVIILLSDGQPYQGEQNPTKLGIIADNMLARKGTGIKNDIYSIAFGSSESIDTLNKISDGKVYSSNNQDELFETFKNIIYEAGDPVEKKMQAMTQVIYSGTKALAGDQKVTITYKGLAKAKEYTFTEVGTSSDGALTYSYDGSTYKLTFNLTDTYLDKDDILITYYVK